MSAELPKSEELTAELAEAMRSGEVVAGLLATERAAREKAEAERDRLQNGMNRRCAELQQAERDRDTALAREERTSRALTRELDRRLAAESALASAWKLLESAPTRYTEKRDWWAARDAWLTSHPAPEGHEFERLERRPCKP